MKACPQEMQFRSPLLASLIQSIPLWSLLIMDDGCLTIFHGHRWKMSEAYMYVR